ncbi:MAG: FAD/NAD(P)-binding protein [Burkholderiales bacterium]|nr:FAD/NAD(P)-binding protein [Burkholderiales bacterium]
MPHTTVCVAGGGSVATSFLHHLVEALIESGCPPGIEITVLEPNDRVGRGGAYSRDLEANLLNIAVGSMSAVADDRGHFRRWLHERGVDSFRGRPVDNDSYVSRPLFGEYLESVFVRTREKAASAGISLRHVRNAAHRLVAGPDDRQVFELDDGTTVTADHAVLAIGNLESGAFGHLRGCPGYFASPYPTASLCAGIPQDAPVGIVGTSLSAVDAIASLESRGHRGPLFAISRNGRLPSVRGRLNTPVALRPGFRDRLHQLKLRHAVIPLDDMIRLVRAELAACAGPLAEDLGQVVSEVPPAREFLDREITLAQAVPRPWQAFLHALNEVVDLLWHLLPPPDRERFTREMKTVWMARRVSFPLENALVLQGLLGTGRLAVLPGFRGASYDPADRQFVVEREQGPALRVPFLVNATSFSADVAACGMPLLQYLLADGGASADPFGGLRLDFDSGCLVTRDGRLNPRVTVLGTMAAGTYFWTNSMDTNARLAMGQAGRLAARLGVRRADPAAVA